MRIYTENSRQEWFLQKEFEINVHYCNNKFILFAFIFISIFNFNKQENYDTMNIKYPSAFLLLNNKYVVVGDKGIYFYNKEFTIIYNHTNFTNFSLFIGEHETVSFAQFPEADGGYILIMVKKMLYIFDVEGTYLNNFDFKNITNEKHHCLIPYGKENDILNFFKPHLQSPHVRTFNNNF